MPVDIEQWCAGIENFNGCCQYSVARFELSMYNVFSMILMFACMFLVILLCISNPNIILHFLLVSSVFTFSLSVLELLIYRVFYLKINILLHCIESVNYIYQQFSYTCMLNTILFLNILYFVYFLHLFVLQHGDIERNLGQQSGQSKNISCCHWSFNSLVAQNLSKISQLEAYNSLYKHDFICISEAYCDLSILERDTSFQLDGYKIIRADHPSNTKRGAVWLYYVANLSKCIIFEVSIQSCKGYVGVIYRSPSQNTTEFEEF